MIGPDADSQRRRFGEPIPEDERREDEWRRKEKGRERERVAERRDDTGRERERENGGGRAYFRSET